MFNALKESLQKWNTKYGERAKLQHAYIVAAIGLVVVAGIVGLINHNLSQNILLVAIVSAGAFLINAVVWSLLQSAVLSRISARRKVSDRKK